MRGMEIDVAAAKVARRGVLLLDDLRNVGVTEKAAEDRVRAGVWGRRASGLYVVNAAPRDWRQDLLAAHLAAGPHAAVAGLSSPALWGVPGFPEGPVDIASPVGCNHSPALGKLRQSCDLREHHVVVLDGIRVTRPSRMLFDLAALIRPERLERAASNAIAMRLTNERNLFAMLDELGKRGRPGTAAFRYVLERRASGMRPDSGLEAIFLRQLEREGLPIPECQVWLGDDELIGRVDFFWRRHSGVGEVDSDRFHRGPLDVRADEERDARLRAAGLRIERFPEWEIRQAPEKAMARARRFLEAA
jgi:hypothetical protein